MSDFTTDLKYNEAIKLEPSALLYLYELDLTPIFDFAKGAVQKHFYFHSYPVREEDSNSLDINKKKAGVLLWNGNEYYPLPLTVDGFEMNTQGTLPRPTFRVANIVPFVRDLTRIMDGLAGAKVIRRKVFYKNLDNLSEADINASFGDELYLVNRKKSETKSYIEFELITPVELGDLQLPRRQIITNTCPWVYRCEGCGYADKKIADINDTVYGTVGYGLIDKGEWTPNTHYDINDVVWISINNVPYYYMAKVAHTSSYQNKFSANYWVVDDCSKTIKGCKIRFDGQPLPMGSFPSTNVT